MNETEGSSRKRRQAPGSSMEVMVYIDQGVESDASNIGIDSSDYILAIINIVRLKLPSLIFTAINPWLVFFS